jgi:hypothetical protein
VDREVDDGDTVDDRPKEWDVLIPAPLLRGFKSEAATNPPYARAVGHPGR